MQRRTFLKTAGSMALTMSFPPWFRCSSRTRKPNILFIMTDQQFADAMSNRIGDKYIQTPAMDSLADNGMLFKKAYCANPLCVPSRTSIFTGRYPHETGVQINGKQKLDTGKFPIMGTIFKQAGYDTGYVGKWHISIPRVEKAAHGFDYMKNIKNNGGDNYSPDPAVEFINKKREKSFLLVVSFVNPHNICQWARGQELPDGPIGEPPPLEQCPPLLPNHLPPENETDIMALMRRSYQKDWHFPVSDFDDKKWREYIWAYCRMIEMVDGHISKVLQALRESGQEQNTLVVFTSDHGDCQGAHKWNQKTVLYDEASRVPFIISYKGVTRAGTSDRLVHTGVDIIPTLCDYAGIRIPESLPGKSLKDAANGRGTADPREYIVISNKMVQSAEVDGVKPEPAGRMVRSKRFKYCIYDMGKRRESLIDMEKDPGEMVNLAENSQYKDVLELHRKYLVEWCKKTKDPFPAPEQFTRVGDSPKEEFHKSGRLIEKDFQS